MKQQQFEVGCIVRLVSSKVKMTVSSIYLNGNVSCIWLDKNRNLQQHLFVPSTLVLDEVHVEQKSL
jgi:uncharacterized protein YodC (DUF2158 family)